MASASKFSNVSRLEDLPLLVLERICEYLDSHEDERRSLWEFTLTSKSCCSAATAQRFCQVRLTTRAEDVQDDVRKLNEFLENGDRYRHVCRLKVSWIETSKESWYRGFNQTKDNYSFDMHDFCRPATSLRVGTQESLDPMAWTPFIKFLGRLSGLRDLVWAYGSSMPRNILSAITDNGCRLHMHDFRPQSVVQERDNQKAFDLDEYALCSSPALYSVIYQHDLWRDDGRINYIGDVVQRMATGVAPNLAHLRIDHFDGGSGLAQNISSSLGKPPWAGFFPREKSDPHQHIQLGSLRSLVDYHSYVPFSMWSAVADFSNLRSLERDWDAESGLALTQMAIGGKLKFLRSLQMGIYDEREESQRALHQFLNSLERLEHLDLRGYISPTTFEIVLCRHGPHICRLSIDPYRDTGEQNSLVYFSTSLVRRIAENCLNLERISIHIQRARGDSSEVEVYRALARLPRLTYASLNLYFSIGPDEQTLIGEYPDIFDSDFPHEMPLDLLREAFSNGAVDSKLARSIFDVISPCSGSVRYLRLEPQRRYGPFATTVDNAQFQGILRWFNRPWVCTKNEKGLVTVAEFDEKGTLDAEKEWRYIASEEEKWYGEENYEQVFKELWPQKTAEWWNDWESLPLDLS